MTIYFISGLGADERMFQKLSLPDYWNYKHLSWLDPLYQESLPSYSRRLSEKIDTNEEFVLIGLSFGGMVAVELTRIIKPKLTILISSAASKNELPFIARFFAKTKLDAFIPVSLLKASSIFISWLFGTKSTEEKALVRESIVNTPSLFLKWAIGEIINWKNEQRPCNIIHIQGTKDHLIPIENTRADIKVKEGGHLMIYNKANEISRILIESITSRQ